MADPMTRKDVLRIVREAREAGEIPVLSGADLRDTDLSYADLSGAILLRADLSNTDLSYADLSGADLRVADMSGADLSYAVLSGAGLYDADLRDADLSYANLSEVSLPGADLSWAFLNGADLSGASLRGANLREAKWGGLCIDGLHPYRCMLIPLPTGWVVEIGCWSGTLFELRELIVKDDGWPEATGVEIARRRTLLAAFADMCDAHIAGRPNVIEGLEDNWGL